MRTDRVIATQNAQRRCSFLASFLNLPAATVWNPSFPRPLDLDGGRGTISRKTTTKWGEISTFRYLFSTKFIALSPELLWSINVSFTCFIIIYNLLLNSLQYKIRHSLFDIRSRWGWIRSWCWCVTVKEIISVIKGCFNHPVMRYSSTNLCLCSLYTPYGGTKVRFQSKKSLAS